MTQPTRPAVAVLMGSGSDAPLLEPCFEVLRQFEIPFEVRVLSAHRTPDETAAFVRSAEERGVQVIIETHSRTLLLASRHSTARSNNPSPACLGRTVDSRSALTRVVPDHDHKVTGTVFVVWS